jgi:thiol:disulfide interchange protein DsbD
VNSCHNTRKEILKESLLYTAGILISFILLAFTVIILKESGEAVGWGFQFQNPSFVFGLLLIIWVFSLSLFDLYLIELPGMSLANGVGSKSGGMGTFLSGVFAVLLATPCTAPLLGTAIGFAFQSPPIVIFLTMLLIGLGMAMPFILLSLVPNITKFVPKPGNWMNNFRVCMGFTLIATSIFLLRTLSYMVSIENLVNILWFLLIISFVVWVYGKLSSPRYSKKVRWLALASAILLSFFTGKLLLNLEYSTNDCDQSSAIKEHYIKFSEKQLNEYLSEKRKVFIVFGAQWCMTCKLNERGALSKEAVLDAFTKNDVALMYGDFTRKSPELLSYLHKFNRSGVPLYIYYDPSAKDPVILPEVITEKMILKLLQGKK